MVQVQTVGNAGVAVISTRERNNRACFLVARVVIAAGLSGVIAACSINTLSTALVSPIPSSEPSSPEFSVAVAPKDAIAAAYAAVPQDAAVPIFVPAAAPREADVKDEAVLRARPYRRIGPRYQIAGSWYEPKEDPDYDQSGMASWYGDAFHGRMTANGEVFDSREISAAHPTLPLPSYVKVTNLENKRSIVVRVNDRGPFRHQRLIDVSEATAELLGFHRKGLTKVRVEYVAKAPLEEESQSVLLASLTGPDLGKPATPGVMVASLEPQPVPAAKRPADAFAFAPDGNEEREVGAAAMESLTTTSSAGERILVAFEIADAVEQ
jgi:rare lipoprotein A (peptidoglycan hydrolase)